MVLRPTEEINKNQEHDVKLKKFENQLQKMNSVAQVLFQYIYWKV